MTPDLQPVLNKNKYFFLKEKTEVTNEYCSGRGKEKGTHVYLAPVIFQALKDAYVLGDLHVYYCFFSQERHFTFPILLIKRLKLRDCYLPVGTESAVTEQGEIHSQAPILFAPLHITFQDEL